MGGRVKRTYNLSPSTVARVRELAGEYGAAGSQDAVVDLAVERLYAEIRERLEADQWARAGEDAEFRAEMTSVATDLDGGTAWPR